MRDGASEPLRSGKGVAVGEHREATCFEDSGSGEDGVEVRRLMPRTRWIFKPHP